MWLYRHIITCFMAIAYCYGETISTETLSCPAKSNDGSCSEVRSSSEVKGSDSETLPPSLVVKHIRGRLGNHIWGYMMALGMEMKYGVKGLITREANTHMLNYFENLQVGVAEDDACGYEEYYKTYLSYLYSRIVLWYEDRIGHELAPFPRGKDNRMAVPPELYSRWKVKTYDVIENETFWSDWKPTFLEPCAYTWKPFLLPFNDLGLPFNSHGHHWHLHPGHPRGEQAEVYNVPGFEPRFKQALKLKKSLVEGADLKLHQVKKTHLEKKDLKGKKKKKKEMLFVGVHCRRTDHIEFEVTHGYVPLKHTYYLDAMDLFRSHFRKTHRVVFVFVSDDMEWGRKKIGRTNKRGDIYFVGDGTVDKVDAIGADLALLAGCNHTILSYGSFSYFAGYLSGGIVVNPEHYAEYRIEENWVYPLTKHPIEEPLPPLPLYGMMEKVPKEKRKYFRER